MVVKWYTYVVSGVDRRGNPFYRRTKYMQVAIHLWDKLTSGTVSYDSTVIRRK